MLRSILPSLVLLLASGCASTSGQPITVANGDTGGLYYVEHQVKDGRHLETLIAEVLRERGLRASSGEPADRPESAAYIVTYEDRWSWDMRMYLKDLRINVRDAETDEFLGYGRSKQDSLSAMGDSFRDIVVKAVDELLKDEDS